MWNHSSWKTSAPFLHSNESCVVVIKSLVLTLMSRRKKTPIAPINKHIEAWNEAIPEVSSCKEFTRLQMDAHFLWERGRMKGNSPWGEESSHHWKCIFLGTKGLTIYSSDCNRAAILHTNSPNFVWRIAERLESLE